MPSSGNGLTPLEKKAFENIVQKGENAGNQHFLLFKLHFLLFPTQISFSSHNCFLVCKCFEFGEF